LSYANDMVDRRAFTRDRRLFGDRRSIILPNLSDESRRITVTDRRSRFVDRRSNNACLRKGRLTEANRHHLEVQTHVHGTFRR
jgi:hypothetical protein